MADNKPNGPKVHTTEDLKNPKAVDMLIAELALESGKDLKSCGVSCTNPSESASKPGKQVKRDPKQVER